MVTTGTPLRYRPDEVAELLRVDRMTVYQKVRNGELSGLRPDGKGPGKKLYLRPGEVAAYAEGGAAAAKAWRKANRIPEPKSGK